MIATKAVASENPRNVVKLENDKCPEIIKYG
jgi:hypothetical protein